SRRRHTRWPRDWSSDVCSSDLENVIATSVVSAFRQLKEFFVKQYLPAGWDQVGIWQLPEGEAMYRFAVRLNTTTDMTPREIHERSEERRVGKECRSRRGRGS